MTNKQPTLEEWENRFDKEFDQYYGKNSVGFVSPFNSKAYDDIKQFIRQELARAELEVYQAMNTPSPDPKRF